MNNNVFVLTMRVFNALGDVTQRGPFVFHREPSRTELRQFALLHGVDVRVQIVNLDVAECEILEMSREIGDAQ